MPAFSSGAQPLYRVPTQEKTIKTVVKGSVFLTTGCAVHSESEVKRAIQLRRDEHPKCNHVVWAYRIGDSDGFYGMSDDGEPKGAAGRPTLKVLQTSPFSDTLITVVRYFGGVKLGKGGLVRAYTACAKSMLNELPFRETTATLMIRLRFGYQWYEAVASVLRSHQAQISKRVHAEDIVLYCTVQQYTITRLESQLADTTRGKVQITLLDA